MPHSHVKLSGGLAGYSATAHTQRWKGAERSHPLCRSQHLPFLALLCWLICTAGMGHRTTLSIQYHWTKTHTHHPTMHCRYGAQDNTFNTIPLNKDTHTPTNHALLVWGTGQHFQYNTVEQRKTHTNQPCTAGMQVCGTGQHFQYNTVPPNKQTSKRTNQLINQMSKQKLNVVVSSGRFEVQRSYSHSQGVKSNIK